MRAPKAIERCPVLEHPVRFDSYLTKLRYSRLSLLQQLVRATSPTSQRYPAVHDEGRVCKVGDSPGILWHGGLSGYRITLAGVDLEAVNIGAAELPEMKVWGFIFDQSPPRWVGYLTLDN